jgi:predicted unusual protein kinase regulating ubiquinone biosynthesis (AarF/ABC1/UbiB family)
MLETAINGESLQSLTFEDIRLLFFAAHRSCTERVAAIESLLRGPQGPIIRERVGRWVVDRLPSKELVPEKYAHWRPLVEDAMLYWFEHLSSERLASKLVEQLELPSKTPTGERLLKLIAKVPGLQKLGQVLARNRNLHPDLRSSLTDLENGISDMRFADVRRIIVQELGIKLKAHAVKIERGIFSEASVSSVVRFTWRNPGTGARERGVFKVMKPYIPTCFAEDMRLLGGLATYVGTKGRKYGFAKRVLPETFSDVRQLLQHEVEFEREQKTLGDAFRLYGTVLSLRVPRVIRPLCTPNITAMTEERGQKVTDAAAHMPAWRRARLCELLMEAFVAVPLFSA